MRILINGYYTGGNCPPFFLQLKQLGHKIKIYDVGYFNFATPELSDLLKEDDIFWNHCNLLEYLVIKFLKKIKISFWKNIIFVKTKRIVKNFMPDLIINHQINDRVDIMIKTGFKPQVNFIYGSELRDGRINKDVFKKALIFAEHTYGTVDETIKIISAYYPTLKHKLKTNRWGLLGYDELTKIKKKSKIQLRKKWGFNQNDYIFFDDRSSRDIEVFEALINTIGKYQKELRSGNFRLLFLRGNGGTDKNIKKVKQLINDYKIGDLVRIINKLLTFNIHLELLWLSNAVVSLLPYDQFGIVIMESMFLEKYMLLFDLPSYKEYIGENAVYCNELDNYLIFLGLKSLLNLQHQINIKKNLEFINNHFNPNKHFFNLNYDLTEILENYRNKRLFPVDNRSTY